MAVGDLEEGREAHALDRLGIEQPDEKIEQSQKQIEQSHEHIEQSHKQPEQSQEHIEQSPELVAVGDLKEGREAHALDRVHTQPLEHVLERLPSGDECQARASCEAVPRRARI